MQKDKRTPLLDFPSDGEVAELLKRQDTTPLWERLLKCKPVLLAYTYRYLRGKASAQNAEECLAQFLAKRQRGIDKNFNPERSFRAYFLESLKNHCGAFAARLDREAKTTISLDTAPGASEVRTELQIPDVCPENDPLQVAIREQFVATVGRCIETLEAKYRDIFLLHYGDDLSYSEIAEKLAISEGTARIRLFRARAQLRTCLEESGFRLR